MRFIAKLVSFILGPQIWAPIIVYMVLSHSNLTKTQSMIIIPLVCFLNLIVPFIYILIAYKKKMIKDLDMTNRKERLIPLIIFITSFLLTTILIYRIGLKELGNIFLFFSIILILNGIITLFWKISLHMAINIVGFLLLIHYYGSIMMVFVIAIPLVYWSRLILKKHTVTQLLMSFLLNGAITYYFLFTSLSFKKFFNFF